MVLFTQEKVLAAFREALERDPEDRIDLLDYVMKELGIASAGEKDIVALLSQLALMPETTAWIRQNQTRLGMRGIAAGQDRLAAWFAYGWRPEGS